MGGTVVAHKPTEEPQAAVKRLEHAVAQLTADLATVRRRLDEAKVAATKSLLRTWEPNKAVAACTSCGLSFSILNWRYHCRSCGRIFCDVCTTSRMRTTFHRLPQRSCQECFDDTLRLQKIRELRQRVNENRTAPAENEFEELEEQFEQPCYSSVCRSGQGGKCYSVSDTSFL